MVGGGNLSKRPGTLSGDGKLLLCPCGRLVHIYSAVTGERVGMLSGHLEEVTGVVLDSENDDQAYSCSLDATVRLWDYRAGTELRRLMIREPVKHMAIHKELGVAYFSVQMREGGRRVALYNIRTGKFSGNALKYGGPLALNPAGSMAATFDRHSLYVWRTGTEIYQPLNLHHTKQYTCLTISADNSLIAAGDVTGRILIWRSFEHSVPSALRHGEHSGKAHAAQQPPLTTVHWHAHPVGALTFSPDGTYLLSGGQEGVLVMWHLETNRRSFLPRIGGPIVGIHPSPADPAKYVVRQADNVVRIVNTATMKVETSVYGVKPPPTALLPPPAGPNGGGVSVLPGSLALVSGGGGAGALVLSCENGQLQFFDIARDQHLGTLPVIPRNFVSMTEHAGGNAAEGSGPGLSGQEPSLPPYVQMLVVSSDGAVLATVDVRPDAGPYGSTEACLKFWDASGIESSAAKSGPRFVLNTRVDEPHRDMVASLTYHPSRHMAVTTGGHGNDSDFKVWVQERQERIGIAANRSRTATPGADRTAWRCRSAGGYKGLPLGASAFSADGSVLAVAAASRVTLWDAETNVLAAVLPAAATGPSAPSGPVTAASPLTKIVFVPGTPFLAVASPTCLAVYNLLNVTLHWCLSLDAISISADAAHGLVAVALPVTLGAPAVAPGAPDPAPGEAATAPPLGAADARPGAAAPGEAAAEAVANSDCAEAAATPGSSGRGAGRRSVSVSRPAPTPPPCCQVVMFDPRDAAPRYHCLVPQAKRVHITHLRGGGGGPEGCSPLLILRDDRQYSIAMLPGSKTVPDAGASQAALERDTAPSAFEAAFGRPTGQEKASGAAPMELDVAPGAGIAPGVRPVWAELFDAPSHVLPPATALASAFLALLTKVDS